MCVSYVFLAYSLLSVTASSMILLNISAVVAGSVLCIEPLAFHIEAKLSLTVAHSATASAAAAAASESSTGFPAAALRCMYVCIHAIQILREC